LACVPFAETSALTFARSERSAPDMEVSEPAVADVSPMKEDLQSFGDTLIF
jgi:hypothetical protein